jgi:hypothetical protein
MSSRSISRNKEARLPNGTAQVAAQFVQREGRLLRGVRVTRVPEIVREIVAHRGVEFLRTGLGEDLDPAEAQLVELRRERILVDANLADRFLGRKLAATESVDENLAAIRPSRRPGQREQVCLQGRQDCPTERRDPRREAPARWRCLTRPVLTAGPARSCTVTCCVVEATFS